MPYATLTTKGQVTIPKEVRESLRLRTGDKIEFVIKESREAIIKPVSKKVDDVFCMLRKPGRKTLTTEEINSVIKKRMRGNLP